MNQEIDIDDVKWMDEKIENFPGKKGYYRLMCFLLGKKKLTYSDLYVITYSIHKNKFKDNELSLKEKIIKDLAMIYYYNNKKLPNGFEFTDK